jgi:hypothetical protein
MGLLFLDSFDDRYFTNGASYSAYHSKWDVVFEDSTSTYANSISQVTGRTGKACKIGGSSYLQKTVNISTLNNSLMWGCALSVSAAPLTETTICQVNIDDGGDIHNYYYKLQTNLYVKLYYDSTEIGTSISAISTNTFYYIESQVVNASATSINLYKDGVNWLNVINIAPPVSLIEPIIPYIKFSGGIIIDDLYLYENSGNTFLGQIKIDAIVPTSNGTADTNAWQSISYLDVDECFQSNHDGDTSVDDSNTASPSRVTYNFDDQSNKTIKGVQSLSWVRRLNVSPPALNVSMTAITRISGTYYDSNTISSNGNYAILIGLWENNPNSSSAWNLSSFNSAEFGVKAAPSSTNLGRLTALTLELAYIPIAPAATSRVFIIS